jgi:hypothetical protein
MKSLSVRAGKVYVDDALVAPTANVTLQAGTLAEIVAQTHYAAAQVGAQAGADAGSNAERVRQAAIRAASERRLREEVALRERIEDRVRRVEIAPLPRAERPDDPNPLF